MLRKSLVAGFAAALAFIPAAAMAAPGFVDGTTEVHAGPDFDYPTVDVVEDGQSVEVFGCLEDVSWCDIDFQGQRGWINADNLVALYEYERRPIAYAAPYIGLSILAFSFDSYWDAHYHHRPFYRERSRWHGFYQSHYRDSWRGGRQWTRGGRDWDRDRDRGRDRADRGGDGRDRDRGGRGRTDNDRRNGASAELARQRAERDAHQRAHDANVRSGMYKRQEQQRQQKAAHEAARQRNEAARQMQQQRSQEQAQRQQQMQQQRTQEQVQRQQQQQQAQQQRRQRMEQARPTSARGEGRSGGGERRGEGRRGGGRDRD